MKAKKFLAVLLAVAMVMAGSIVGFAADVAIEELPIGFYGVDGVVGPDETLVFDISVNGRTQMANIQGHVENGAIESVASEQFTVWAGGAFGPAAVEFYPKTRLTFDDVGTPISDTLKIVVDGVTYSFPIVANATGKMVLELEDSLNSKTEYGEYGGNVLLTEEEAQDLVVGIDIRDEYNFSNISNYAPEYEIVQIGFISPGISVGEATLSGSKILVPVTITGDLTGDDRGDRFYFTVMCSNKTNSDFVSEMFAFRIPSSSSTESPAPTPSTPVTNAPTQTEEKQDTTRNENYETIKTALRDLEDANSGKTSKVKDYTTAAGVTVPAVPVRLNGAAASVTVEAMERIAAGSTGLCVSLDGGAAELLLPAGFTMPANTGLLSYPIGIQQNPTYGSLIMGRVKGADAQSEVIRVGGDITLPTTVTVTLKTQLKGTVNIYVWDEDTRKVTFLGTAAVQNGKVTFATKQLGGFLLTTGTI